MLMTLCLFAVCAQEGRAPVPDAGAQRDAEKLIRDLFKEDYARKTPSERTALSRKLLKQGRETKDNAAAAYVLLREAKDLAASAGDLDLAMKAVDEIAGAFDGPAGPLRFGVLVAVERVIRTPEEFQRLAKGYLAIADESIAAGEFDSAERAAAAGIAAAKKSKDVPLVTRLEGKGKEVAELRSKLEKASKAKEALSKNPDDPAANLAMGQHLCFVQDDWEVGLKHFLKGSDPGLKALAEKDLAPAGAMSLGDGWWDRADKESGIARAKFRERAAFWYRQAIPNATGLSKLRIEKRVAEAEGALSPTVKSDVDLLARFDPKLDSIRGVWRTQDGKLISPVVTDPKFASCAIPYVPPAEYDLTVVAERRSGISSLLVGLIGGGSPFAMELDGYNGVEKKSFSGLDRIRGQSALTNGAGFRGGIYADGKLHTVVCRVRRDRVTISLDGQEVLDWKADYTLVSLHDAVDVRNPGALFLGAWNSEYVVHRLSLKPVGGEGRFLR